MKKRVRLLVCMLVIVMISVCVCVGFTSCNFYDRYASKYLNSLADTFTSLMLGGDVLSWNVFSVNPEASYGYVKDEDDATWYSYRTKTQDDIDGVGYVFSLFASELNRIKPQNLNKADMVTYRTMKHVVDSYVYYYGSDHALDFDLISGDYINSQGGYVADFTSSVENFTFRTKDDVEDLLAITRSTKDAFETYINYVSDRVIAGYPLYDYTINSMIDYLDDVLEQGDNFYLYAFVNNKIDSAEFLTEAQKTKYKNDYKQAITDSFMAGVQALSDGLENYTGYVTQTNMSYLASYGNLGKEYYLWSFKNKTGLTNVDINDVFNDISAMYRAYNDELDEVLDYVESVKETDTALYDEFYSYISGEKKLLDLETPEEILTYLKSASENIVPALKTEPTIDFKYMDETAGKITSVVAYYLLSPMDENNSNEHITLNKYYVDENPDENLLVTIGHEGYPGHLYAHVNAKENGIRLLSEAFRASAFSEGWAVYTELAILDNVASDSESRAVDLFCDYYSCYIVTGYLSALMADINVNYYGASVQDFVNAGLEEESARRNIEYLMEMPTTYVPYAYGAYAMIMLHDTAKQTLGSAYVETEFNGLLLSEGSGPTLDRAKQITEEYIKSKTAV